MAEKPMMRKRARNPVLLPPLHDSSLQWHYYFKMKTSKQDVPDQKGTPSCS